MDGNFVLVVNGYDDFAVVRLDEWGNQQQVSRDYRLDDCLKSASSAIGFTLSIPLVVSP